MDGWMDRSDIHSAVVPCMIPGRVQRFQIHPSTSTYPNPHPHHNATDKSRQCSPLFCNNQKNPSMTQVKIQPRKEGTETMQ